MIAKITLVLSFALVTFRPAFAHDLWHSPNNHQFTRFDEDELNQEAQIATEVSIIGPISTLDPEKLSQKDLQRIGEKSLFGMALRWPDGKVLSVCMQHESRKLRVLIAKVADEWMKSGANIHLDFGDSQDPRRCDSPTAAVDIRIADDPNSPLSPFWSYVGTQALNYPNQWTMDLGFANGTDADAAAALAHAAAGDTKFRNYFHFVVLHEFGHALGALHEHQWGTCAKYLDTPVAVRLLFPNATTREEKQEAAANLEALTKNEIDVWGAVRLSKQEDPDSVMRYDFPQEVYDKVVGGQTAPAYCSNRTIEYASKEDLAGMAIAYPPPSQLQAPATIAATEAAARLAADHANALSAAARTRLSAAVVAAVVPGASAPATRRAAPALGMAAPARRPSQPTLPKSGIALLNKLVAR